MHGYQNIGHNCCPRGVDVPFETIVQLAWRLRSLKVNQMDENGACPAIMLMSAMMSFHMTVSFLENEASCSIKDHLRILLDFALIAL